MTLGTLSIFRGFMLTFIGQKQITTLPPGMREFGRMMVIRGTNPDGSFYSLHAAFLVTVAVVVLTWAILHRTMLGRKIFAIGGSVESARRIGIDVRADAVLRLRLRRRAGGPGRASSTPRWRGWRTRSTSSGWSSR